MMLTIIDDGALIASQLIQATHFSSAQHCFYIKWATPSEILVNRDLDLVKESTETSNPPYWIVFGSIFSLFTFIILFSVFFFVVEVVAGSVWFHELRVFWRITLTVIPLRWLNLCACKRERKKEKKRNKWLTWAVICCVDANARQYLVWNAG